MNINKKEKYTFNKEQWNNHKYELIVQGSYLTKKSNLANLIDSKLK